MVARLRVLSRATEGSHAQAKDRETCRVATRLIQVGLAQSFSDSSIFHVCVVGHGRDRSVLLSWVYCIYQNMLFQ